METQSRVEARCPLGPCPLDRRFWGWPQRGHDRTGLATAGDLMGLLPLFQMSSKRALITGITGRDGSYQEFFELAERFRAAAGVWQPINTRIHRSRFSVTTASPVPAARVRRSSSGCCGTEGSAEGPAWRWPVRRRSE